MSEKLTEQDYIDSWGAYIPEEGEHEETLDMATDV